MTVNAPRLFRTVQRLRPVQIYGQAMHRLPRAKTIPADAPAPPRRAWPCPWANPVTRRSPMVGAAQVRFLNEDGALDGGEIWNDPARSKLWLYNLHYFDGLSGDAGTKRAPWRRAMIARWIAQNPPGLGIGWDAYPTSLRIVNWIKWALAGGAMEPDWLHSLAVQARWLEGRLEWRLLGNHLLANAKALITAGLFFEGSEAERWLARGLAIWDRQLAEQILPDGGHIERSPMYHALVLEDLLDLYNFVRASAGPEHTRLARWAEHAGRMQSWLAAMTHPDGEIGFFNDAAFEVAATLVSLDRYAVALGLERCAAPAPGVTHLNPSGYIRLQTNDAVALIDAAPIGPDHLTGHAHADTLSFELSLGLERLIVNGGVNTYGEGADRQVQRSTAAHSTVEIDGENSSEVWAGFRVGRRAQVRDVQVACDDGVSVSAAHDGYVWRPGRPVHHRSWRMQPGRLTVDDRIEGSASTALARFHLGAGVAPYPEPGGLEGALITSSGRRVRWRSSEPVEIQPSQWRPEFGKTVQTRQLAIPLGRDGLHVEFNW